MPFYNNKGRELTLYNDRAPGRFGTTKRQNKIYYKWVFSIS